MRVLRRPSSPVSTRYLATSLSLVLVSWLTHASRVTRGRGGSVAPHVDALRLADQVAYRDYPGQMLVWGGVRQRNSRVGGQKQTHLLRPVAERVCVAGVQVERA